MVGTFVPNVRIMTRTDLLKEIEDFAEANKLAPATVTSRAVGNSRLYHRMKAGGGCNVIVAERLRQFIAKANQASGLEAQQ